MTFDVILAIDENYGIGKNNFIPWRCPKDLQIFKNKTQNSIIIVGRNTAQSLPYLVNRTVFCVSTSLSAYYSSNHKNNMSIFSTFEEALLKAKDTGFKIFVVGGAVLYNYVFSNHLDKIGVVHVSYIKGIYDCDTLLSDSSVNILKNFSVVSIEEYENFIHFEYRYTKYSEEQYLTLVRDVLKNGNRRESRNGAIISCFVKHLKFDLRDGFPLLTTKKMFLRGIIEELLFFIRGETDSKILEDKNVNIWKGNTSREYLDSIGKTERREGVMGPMYGYQWRNFNALYDEETGKAIIPGIDQLSNVINLLRNNPTSRRIIMTTYNPDQVDDGVLPPCHSIVLQFYSSDGFLDTFCYNRSSDIGLGLPFNIASTSLLILLIGKLTGLNPRYFDLSLGDAHIYENHQNSLIEQINRRQYTFPTISLPDIRNLEDLDRLSSKDFVLNNYRFHPPVSMSMVV